MKIGMIHSGIFGGWVLVLAAGLASPAAAASIDFAPDAATLPSSAKPMLDHVAEALAADHRVNVILLGHADGPARRLSLEREITIRDYLLSRGVAESRLKARVLADDPGSNRIDIEMSARAKETKP
ncbi:MAG TPA: OmpA family protein [Stellaceae bacterium]|nr:OmpA family protein [Stellaceae bacterium]